MSHTATAIEASQISIASKSRSRGPPPEQVPMIGAARPVGRGADSLQAYSLACPASRVGVSGCGRARQDRTQFRSASLAPDSTRTAARAGDEGTTNDVRHTRLALHEFVLRQARSAPQSASMRCSSSIRSVNPPPIVPPPPLTPACPALSAPPKPSTPIPTSISNPSELNKLR